jgi:exopolysaccharide biosynthesis polyprenyl glycosylphosphotransferase
MNRAGSNASLRVDTLFGLSASHQNYPAGRFKAFASLAEMICDFSTGVVCIYFSYFLYLSLHIGRQVRYPTHALTTVAIAAGIIIVILMGKSRAYGGGGSLLRIGETTRAIRIPLHALLMLFPVVYFLGVGISRYAFLFALVVVPSVMVIQKQLFSSAVRAMHARGHGISHVAIYGAGYTGKRVLSALFQSMGLGMKPIAIIDDDQSLSDTRVFELGYRREHSVTVRSGPVTSEMLTKLGCKMLIIAIPSLSSDRFSAVYEAANSAGVKVAFLSNRTTIREGWMESIDLDGMPLSLVSEPVTPLRYAITKKLFDISLSLALLVVLCPFFVAISLLIKVDSSGPALFIQKRVGKDGALFDIYKFRSMRIDVPRYGLSPQDSLDTRITRVGRLLRRSSVDELPQLLNVLKGDMSLVGPRPEMPFVVDTYEDWQRQRLKVTPGITGLWQISADRAFLIHENIHYDLYYIRHRSFLMDLAILAHTALVAMRGR